MRLFSAGRPWHYLILSAMGLVLFFFQLGAASLWDVDEGRNATASLEMLETGNLIVPTFNAQLRVDKPALLYWLQVLSYQAFGVNEFAARFPSALAALFTVLLAYELGRSLFGPMTGFWAGCLAATTPLLTGAARFANPDALLNCFTLLTLTLFWVGQRWPRGLWFSSMGAAAGLAVLAKGPVGVVLPGGIIFLFLLWEGRLKTLLDRRLIWGIVALFLVAAPWWIWVTVDTKGEFLRLFLFKHNVSRFVAPMENHSGFPGFYLVVLLLGTLPWSIFFGLTCWYTFWSVRRRPAPRWQATWEKAADREGSDFVCAPYRFLAAWCLLYLVFFTVAATKLPNYVLPVVVPLSILTARFLERWRQGAIQPPRPWIHLSLSCLGLTGLGLGLGVLIVSGTVSIPGLKGRWYPELAPWAWMGLVPVAGALLGWWLLARQKKSQWIACLVVCALVFWGPMAAWANAAFNAFKAAQPLVASGGACQRDREIQIGCFQMEHLASLHFYVRRNITHHLSEAEAQAFLRYPLKVYLFVPATVWDSWQGRVPTACRVLSRHPDLYRSDEAVLVTNRE